MNDDFNSPMVIAQLFDAARIINLVKEGKEKMSDDDKALLAETYRTFMDGYPGPCAGRAIRAKKMRLISGLMETIIDIRAEARAKKDFATSDQIRDKLLKINIQIKDGKEGASWEMKEEV